VRALRRNLRKSVYPLGFPFHKSRSASPLPKVGKIRHFAPSRRFRAAFTNYKRRSMNGKESPRVLSSNIRKFPHFGDQKNFPWTMGWQPTYQTEGRIYAKYILQNLPQGKIGILYQNDDSGRDYVKGLKDGLGVEAAKRMIVAELPYDPSEPTVDSQVVTLKTMGADVFFQRNCAEVRGAGDLEGG
jgi:hypothetical protein